MGNRVSMIATIIIMVCSWNLCIAQISADRKSYTTKSGDTLQKIAEKLGDRDFWKSIYSANANVISNSGFIEKGQVLTLPSSVTKSSQFKYADSSEDAASQTSRKAKLKKFRAAFNSLVKQEEDSVAKESKSGQKDPALDLGGFVLDETRSKMGRDFYNLFYQHWQPPRNASNFTIAISEQPTFGRGSQITIKLDYTEVFSARLQPRYEFIEALSKQAVTRCQRAVQQQSSVRNQLMGY